MSAFFTFEETLKRVISTQSETLDLSHKSLITDELDILVEAIEAGTLAHVRNLNLNDAFIHDEGIGKITAAARRGGLVNLEVLSLRETAIWNDGLQHLVDAIEEGTFKKLHDIDLHLTSIHDDGISAFVELAHQSKLEQLTTLNLSATNIGDEGIQKLVELAQEGLLENLVSFGIGGARVTDAGIDLLCDASADGLLKNVNHLDFCYSRITDQGLHRLSEAIEQAPWRVQSLGFRKTRITDSGLFSLIRLIKNGHLPELERLHLEGTRTGDQAYVQFFNALINSPLIRLRNLGVGYGFSDESTSALAEAIRQQRLALPRRLRFQESLITGSGLKHLSSLVKDGFLRELVELNIDETSVGDDGLLSLANAIEPNKLPLLEALSITSTEISDTSFCSLIEAIGRQHDTAFLPNQREIPKHDEHATYQDRVGRSIPLIWLRFSEIEVSDKGMLKLFRYIENDCFPNLTNLVLSNKAINRDFKRLTTIIQSGKLSNLRTFDGIASRITIQVCEEFFCLIEGPLAGRLNSLGIFSFTLRGEGKSHLLEAIQKGKLNGLNAIVLPKLHSDQLNQLTESLELGHLEKCEKLSIKFGDCDRNSVSNLLRTIQAGCLPRLKFLSLNSLPGELENIQELIALCESDAVNQLNHSSLNLTEMTDDSLTCFLEGFQSKSFIDLDLLGIKGEVVTDKSLSLLEMIVGEGGLDHLSTFSCFLQNCSEEGVFNLCASLASRPSFRPRQLAIGNVKFTDASLKLFCEPSHSRLLGYVKRIILNNSSITDTALYELASLENNGGLQHLKTIYLDGTDVSVPTELVSMASASAIFEYLRNRQYLLPEFKLLIVGQGRVGKSHVRERLFSEEPDIGYYKKDQESTHDATTESISVMSNDLELGKCQVQVWDFGGQQELQGVHRFFMGAHRCFYIIVADATRPPTGANSNQLDYWLRLVAHYGCKPVKDQEEFAPATIVMTQCDEIELLKSQNITDKRTENYRRNLDFIESMKTAEPPWFGANVVDVIHNFGWSDEVEALDDSELKRQMIFRHRAAARTLKRAVEKHSSEILEIKYNVEPSLVQLRNHLVDLFTQSRPPEKHLDTDKNEWKEDNPNLANFTDAKLKRHLEVLRNLGIVHWLGDLPEIQQSSDELKRIVFNPEWVRPPVYKLIKTSESRFGRISRDRLQQILPSHLDQPEMKTPYESLSFTNPDRDLIEKLIYACRIGFEIDFTNQGWTGLLIPDLLDPSEQTEIVNYVGPEVLRKRIVFSFLPERVFLRFIAENFKQLAHPEPRCFRDEVELFLNTESGDITQALVRRVISIEDLSQQIRDLSEKIENETKKTKVDIKKVEDFTQKLRDMSKPYIQIAVRGEQREQMTYGIIHSFRSILDREGLDQVQMTTVDDILTEDEDLRDMDLKYPLKLPVNKKDWVHVNGKSGDDITKATGYELSAVQKYLSVSTRKNPSKRPEGAIYSPELGIGRHPSGIIFRRRGHAQQWVKPIPPEKQRKVLNDSQSIDQKTSESEAAEN